MRQSIYSLFVLLILIAVPLKVEAAVLDYYKDWADIKYGTQSDDKKKAALSALEGKLQNLAASEPNNVEVKIVLATVKSTHASLIGGLSALPHVKEAKKLFEEAIAINPKAMDGQAHAILGALYYGVPGWPIAFGDDDEAETHINKALEIAPNSIDANFFWGDYLFEDGKYARAITALEKTIALKPRDSHASYKAADMGRLDEANSKLKAAKEKLKKKSSRGSSLNE